MRHDHKHLFVNARVANPPTDIDTVNNWLLEIVNKINMKVFFGPQSEYCDKPGNEGVTGVCCIETSHLSMHCWHLEEVPRLNFDLYSCMSFDIHVVLETLNRFNPYYYTYSLVDRNNGLETVDKQSVQIANISQMVCNNLKIESAPTKSDSNYNHFISEYEKTRKLYSCTISETLDELNFQRKA